MARISWGKCSIAVARYDGGTEGDFATLGTTRADFHVLATPVNNTTTINVEEGQKYEAEIEGGGNEAVRYDADKQSLEFDVRRAVGRKVISGGGIGQQKGVFVFAVQPEDPNAPSILIEAANLKQGISFNTSDGIYDHYVADALVPKQGQAVKIGLLSKTTKDCVRLEERPGQCVALGDEGTTCGIGFYDTSEDAIFGTIAESAGE